ncbi:hypothetical protein NQ315_007965 [Exocentrus adspersus]|uniref:Uncharacterized protein n=1 Tax=Exocentrus adspersus TaxID=1586481 RepID=A0AAV8V6I5_9CUCU|nr:hypothetical protein NQ315_007965 [Exocentrus adspersus]
MEKFVIAKDFVKTGTGGLSPEDQVSFCSNDYKKGDGWVPCRPIRQDVVKMRTQKTLQLMKGVGVVIPEGGCEIPELQQFQQYLNDFKIVVYAYGNKGRDVIFKGSEEAPSLNLLYHEGHYNVITSLTAAFCCSYYCEACHIPYDHKNEHRLALTSSGGGFDNQFILNYILIKTNLNPVLIMRGTKIIMMEVGNVKFLDSLNYLTRWHCNQSKIAIHWLVWEKKQRGINIVCAAKTEEAQVVGFKVDGYCAETKQVFEFHGCYYHGCATCFRIDRDNPMSDDSTQTLNTRYETTQAKTERLRQQGHEVIEIWECDFRRQLLQNKEICTYTDNHPLLVNTPLNLRDAFFWGRTGNTYEYYKCKDGGENQVMIDECSPLSDGVEGLIIKCTIIPPQNLYHPVLPIKMNDKLMFVLCRKCGEDMNPGSCRHDEEERALVGTWVMDEVNKALEMGYLMLKVYEVWSYKIDQFDKATKIGGLFTSMMNKFVEVKQQASDWPQHCRTEEEKNRYIPLRNGGKLGQRENQPNTAIVRSPEEFFNMLSNPSMIVNAALPINEDVLIGGQHAFSKLLPRANMMKEYLKVLVCEEEIVKVEVFGSLRWFYWPFPVWTSGRLGWGEGAKKLAILFVELSEKLIIE